MLTDEQKAELRAIMAEAFRSATPTPVRKTPTPRPSLRRLVRRSSNSAMTAWLTW